MKNDTLDKKPKRTIKYGINGERPPQTISYDEKMADDACWVKDNLDYYIRNSNFGASVVQPPGEEEKLTKAQLYDLYNNRIDDKIFSYVTNPLNSKKDAYKKFPARLRAYNIIRPNIDLLIGEWNRKLYRYDVINLDGEEVMNAFNLEAFSVFKKNLEQRIVNEYNKIQQTSLPTLEIPDPSKVITELQTNFKDAKAIQGYKALRVLELDLKLKEKFKKMFKDWVIAGECYSWKFINHNTIDYRKLSTLGTACETGNEGLVEDKEWATTWLRISVSDFVDLFYEAATKEEIERIEAGLNGDGTPRQMLWNRLVQNSKSTDGVTHYVDLYYGCWKSRRTIKIISYPNPMTNETEFLEVDETYKVDKEAGEELIAEQVINEVWNGFRGNQDMYFGCGPAEVQRQAVDNISSCKLPINGARFSDTESDNISIVQLGVNYQIMYIVMIYRIEMAIAKSKGIVQFLDRNTIPDEENEEGEEKWLYQAEALGWAMLDFDQDGVNRQFNQFPNVNFSQMKIIMELIEIANWFKDQWEELIGVTRQRKGQNNSRDGLGVTQESIFRSSVISDIIFDGFDDFVESELQGLLDLSKYAWIDGKSAYYKNDDGALELFKIDPTDHASSSYKVYADFKNRNKEKMDLLRQNINAVAQRKDIKLTALADMIFTDSYAELRARLKQAENLEMELAASQAENEQSRAVALEELKREYMQFENMLKVDFMEREADRLDNREYIKGLIKQQQEQGKPLDMASIELEGNQHLERLSKERLKNREIESKERIARMQDITERLKIKASLKNKVVGEK